MKKNRPPGGVERVKLPPDISFSKQPWGDGWAYVFRHRTLGELGRVLLQGTKGDRCCVVSCEVAGDPADPRTTERAAIFKPIGLEVAEKMAAATGPHPSGSVVEALSRPPETLEVIESKHLQCERCDAMVAMLIFAPDATDPGRFEDYARKMYPRYASLNLPTWTIGPTPGDGPFMDRPADILKVWPEREPMQRLRPAEFNPILDRLAAGHCGQARI